MANEKKTIKTKLVQVGSKEGTVRSNAVYSKFVIKDK